ncbi:hypothetical protein BD324DRAFT_653641 [Kockovaella imperatae]|uniref:Uncharacterized protein n=1 Tax=Kockovaella imperatae TaxID=4999 RepID=A0A1Y1U7F0_9TREE|nr:hypothetical protein BD324DRAFT_653641 [Kockovaella imperatae]ORX33943.1 hypothetical protein BD324DRAFT_653641 [Kockovaella imperatae]
MKTSIARYIQRAKGTRVLTDVATTLCLAPRAPYTSSRPLPSSSSLTPIRSLHQSSSSSSSVGASSSNPPSSSTQDPEHPYLWYHTSSSTRRIELSFLPSPPSPGSRTVLGYLPLFQDSGLNDFQENSEFLKLLHDLIRAGLDANVSEQLAFEASARPTDGYINLCDERALPPAGRIAEPEDTLGTVFVQDGQIDGKTYQAMPSYRLITANGPCILPKGLDQFVRNELEKIDQAEKKA